MATESFFSSASLAYLASAGAGKDGKAYSIKPTDGSGDFTFSRGSNLAATRVGPTGLIEKGRENLLTYSNDFSQWTKSGVTATSGQSGYDGSSDAWLITKSGGAFDQMLRNVSSSGVNTISFYAKAGTLSSVYFRGQASSSIPDVKFNLSDGSLTTSNNVISASSDDIGSGWYRLKMTFSNTITNVTIYPDFGQTNAGTIYIQDAQMEIGLAATDVITTGASTGKAGLLEDEPRFDYSGGATCPSLLLEPSRTQLVKYSELINPTISGLSWQQVNTNTFTNNYGIAPDGTQTSTLVQFATTNSGSQLFHVMNFSAAVYTTSIWAKGSGSFKLGFFDNTNVLTDTITLSSDWQRFDVTKTTLAASGSRGVWIYPNADGNTIEIWGGQVEEGSYPTSYIPNHSGGSVTRGEETTSVTGVSSLIGQTEGTFYVDFEYLDGQSAANENWFALESDAGGDRILFYKGATTNQRILIQANASNVYTNSSLFALSAGTRYKLAVRYNSGDIAVYLNGSQLATDTSTYTRTSNLNNITFNESNQALSSRFNQMLVFPEGLSNADLTTLTTL